jgi:hypothetical protein
MQEPAINQPSVIVFFFEKTCISGVFPPINRTRKLDLVLEKPRTWFQFQFQVIKALATSLEPFKLTRQAPES